MELVSYLGVLLLCMGISFLVGLQFGMSKWARQAFQALLEQEKNRRDLN